MDEFKEQVKKGFTACKDDITYLKDTVFNLKEENKSLKENITTLNDTIIELKGEIKGIKIALDYIKELKQEVKIQPQETPKQIEVPTQQPSEQIKQQTKPEMFKDPYEALLAFKAKHNKREVLKQKMMSMVGENGMSLSELKFMIVEHFRFCSKASFYNYLKELEIENVVAIRRENTKNTVYINSIKNTY